MICWNEEMVRIYKEKTDSLSWKIEGGSVTVEEKWKKLKELYKKQ